MNTATIIQLLRHGTQLKQTARTGWVQRGVVQPENVAAHSYGVTFTALLLAQLIDQSLDLGKLLAIATLHDLPEGLTTDIPSPAWRFLPDGSKEATERMAMETILDGVSFATALMAYWEELHANETVESRLVHDADKIDMLLQAVIYEEQTRNQHLSEFWHKPFTFFYPESQAIYEELRQQHNALRGS